jgi:hypothetical protein
VKRVAGVLALEDLLWAGWLAVLRPASGELFVAGEPGGWLLIVASIGFWAAALLGGRGQARGPGIVTVMSLGVCSIMIDAGLKQVGAPPSALIIHTAAVVALAIAAVWQHNATNGGAWVSAPRWVRRGLSWPMIMVLADMFSGLTGALVEPQGWGQESIAEAIFTIALLFAAIMPGVFAFFVVAPRVTIRPEEEASFGTWALRYVWAVAWALAATSIAPLIE